MTIKGYSKYLSKNTLIGFVLITLVMLLQWWQPAWLDRLEGIAYDFKLVNFNPPRPESTANIQIIDIDEKSLTELGRWPWPREKLALLVNELTKQGAVVIAFDMLFSEAQINPVHRIEQHLSADALKRLSPSLVLAKKQLDDDGRFAAEIKQSEVVLGSLLQQDKSLRQGLINSNYVIQLQDKTPHQVPNYQGYNASIASLHQASQGQGFINAIIDKDGFIRRTALISEYKNKFYPSLALDTFRVYSLVDSIEPQWHHAERHSLLTGMKIGNVIVDTDSKGQMLIPYRGGIKSYPYNSAVDVIKQRTEQKRFEGAVVFVGSSSVGMFDLRTTPYSLVYPGVEIHATVFDALLLASESKYQPVQPDWWLGWNMVQLLLSGLLLILLLPRLSPLSMSLTAFIFLSLTWSSNILVWYVYAIHLPIMSVLMLISLISLREITHGFYQENIQRRQVKSIFGQYVPPQHIDELLESPESISTAGERKNLTVLFADIRNFTQISEKMPADELKQLLNEYFSPMTEIIFKHQGTIDKYVGDMIMAFWGAPLSDSQHAQHAVDAALNMLTITDKLSEEFSKKGWPKIEIGIGINTGEMNVGDMGSEFRRAYTVLGDAVNLGARLEGLTKFYGVKLLISEFTECQINNQPSQIIDKVQVKGKKQAINIFMPIAEKTTEAERQKTTEFSSFFQYYQEQKFKEALDLLIKLKIKYGACVLFQRYETRLHHLIENPPTEIWHGIYTHKDK